jgi:hypothetical protein
VTWERALAAARPGSPLRLEIIVHLLDCLRSQRLQEEVLRTFSVHRDALAAGRDELAARADLCRLLAVRDMGEAGRAHAPLVAELTARWEGRIPPGIDRSARLLLERVLVELDALAQAGREAQPSGK